MPWKFRPNHEGVALFWNRVRRTRREDLRTTFEAIFSGGCSGATGVEPHPRASNLHAFRAGRYLIIFECLPTHLVVWDILPIRAEIRQVSVAVLLRG